uniref:Uncharacterized protein n=1 Tax=Arundo donax TaxID=35708 RepID=A0A0A8ZPZ3_ARUDO
MYDSRIMSATNMTLPTLYPTKIVALPFKKLYCLFRFCIYSH